MDLVLFAILGVVTIFLGTGMMFWGRRGRRVDDHPLCRKCGYDLSGSTGPDDSLPDTCPECGCSFEKRRAVRVGNRVRRRGFIPTGMLLLILGLFTLAGVGFIGNDRFVSVQSRPDWMLIMQVEYLQDPAAIGELFVRGERKALTADQYKRLIPAALDVQADLTTPWDPVWGDFIEQAIDFGHTTTAQQDRYFDQIVEGEPKIIIPQTLQMGKSMTWRIDFGELRIGGQRDSFIKLGWGIPFIDGANGDQPGLSKSGNVKQPGTPHQTNPGSFWLKAWDQLEPGAHKFNIRAIAEMELYGNANKTTSFGQRTWYVSGTVELVDPKQ